MSDEATLDNQKSILENQEAILKNQSTIISNQEGILKNQEEIKSNQAVIAGNQSSIIDNQKQIVDNQALLNVIAKTQGYILNAVRKAGGEAESQEETNKFLEGLKNEIQAAVKPHLADPTPL
ncbi:hypothetical protein [Foetidibacter luteolus]|uniref:hypothetical protein n=1 Tax=Foetidibacter luteolus TaxID=2608880 RepID=UPI00129B6ADA|nr:hypothetical protein [Foetidibacter luteolus]